MCFLKYIFVVLITFSFCNGLSQGKKVPRGSGFFFVGMGIFDLESLETDLNREGFGDFNNSFGQEWEPFVVGISGGANYGPFMAGLEFVYTLPSTTQSSSLVGAKATLEGGMAALTVGIRPRLGVLTFDMVGFGGLGFQEMELSTSSSQTLIGNIQVNQSNQKIKLKGTCFTYGVAGSFGFAVGSENGAKFGLGVHGGIVFSAGEGSWQDESKNDVSGISGPSFNGQYVGLAIGMSQ